MEEVKQEAAAFLKVRALWRFFEAEREGNSVHMFEPGAGSPLHTFDFPRQLREDGLCLSDYILEAGPEGRDHLAIFVVTAGEGIREKSEAMES